MIQKARIALIIPLAFLLITTASYCQENTSKFSRKEFYSVMASESIQKVEEQLNLLQKTNIHEKNSYEATLMMKKAGLLKSAGKKLNLFKAGHRQLEAAIATDSNNVELRFLRLMIQENAPGLLGYNDDLDKDSAYIRQSFKTLPVDVRQAITNYSKTSKVLRFEDF
ncbi:MAG: hypothetical protein JWM28_1198 [Chitinophagaceae bacterium]|nr:hypothetical protein [Chitinophagaceae bacterium]